MFLLSGLVRALPLLSYTPRVYFHCAFSNTNRHTFITKEWPPPLIVLLRDHNDCSRNTPFYQHYISPAVFQDGFWPGWDHNQTSCRKRVGTPHGAHRHRSGSLMTCYCATVVSSLHCSWDDDSFTELNSLVIITNQSRRRQYAVFSSADDPPAAIKGSSTML